MKEICVIVNRVSHSRISAKYEYVTLSINKIEIEMLSFEVFIDRYSDNFVLIVHYDGKKISPVHVKTCAFHVTVQ